MRAFQITHEGTQAVAAALRVLLARNAGTAPLVDKDAAKLMAPAIKMGAYLLAERKNIADGIAHLETAQPKTAQRQAKKAELLSDPQTYARVLDAAIGAINDATAAGPNKFGAKFLDRAKLILDTR